METESREIVLNARLMKAKFQVRAVRSSSDGSRDTEGMTLSDVVMEVCLTKARGTKTPSGRTDNDV